MLCRAPILAFLFLALAESVAAQDVSLQIRTNSGRNEFRIGEPILLDLIFSARTSGAYQIATGTSLPDRYPQDKFMAEPARGWEDPFSDYRTALDRAERGGFPNGGSRMSSLIALSPIPFVMSAVLNDYVRFSEPGVYTLRVEDSRVAEVAGAKREHLTLVSNSLNLTILPADAQWQADQLREALVSLSRLREAIQTGARSYPSVLQDSCITIRALGTSGAGAAMTDALNDDAVFSRCGFQAGVWEFPDKRVLRDQMKQLLKNPMVPITYSFVQTMTTVSLLADQRLDQAFSVKPRKIDQQLKQEILNALPAKQDSAQVATLNTLVSISFGRYGGSSEDRVSATKLSKLDSRVLRIANENFERLSPGVQRTILNYRKAAER